MVKRAANRALALAGLQIERIPPPAPRPYPRDVDAATARIIDQVAPYTMTRLERVAVLCDAVRYLVRAGLPGAMVECGVWRGGSMMAVALTLLEQDAADRDLYLFDTFESMPPPTDRDIDVYGRPAAEMFEGPNNANEIPELAVPPIEQVQAAMASTGYPSERVHFVKGMVEDTVPGEAPETIALLRLDTDWYTSTAHEMHHLFPRVVDGGVLIVDDYGIFSGARDAVDEHLAESGPTCLLSRIDHAARIAIVHRGLPDNGKAPGGRAS